MGEGQGNGDGQPLEAYLAWREREIAAGRDDPVPEERELAGPMVSVSLGDATDVDPVLLAAIGGPDGLGGQSLGPQFAQDRAGDVLRPGPVLAALAEQAVTSPGRLTDDELVGVLRASRRLQAREAWRQSVLIAEFARRREAEYAAAAHRGTAAGCRPGGFPGEELAAELLTSRGGASRRIDTAASLAARLPATLAGMAAGLIDQDRADVIAFYTRAMTPADADAVDRALADAAPGLRTEQLARRAAALEMKLAPEAARARKDYARETARRVETRREMSGNACLSGREMDTADVLASKAYIDAIAARLRAAGMNGPIGALRALALADLTQGRNPLDRINPRPGPAASPAPPAPPVPALINITVPAAALLGQATALAQAGTWGPLDAGETRTILSTAARHPATRYCFTLLDPDGTAIAHGCARGQPPPALTHHTGTTGTAGATSPGPPRHRNSGPSMPGPGEAAALVRLITTAPITFHPITCSTCDHAAAENRYTPSRALRHLIRTRNNTCTAPACTLPATTCDLDHTTPHPHGPTCPCNLGPLRSGVRKTGEAHTRLESRTDDTGHLPLDPPLRPHLHHQPNQLRHLRWHWLATVRAPLSVRLRTRLPASGPQRLMAHSGT